MPIDIPPRHFRVPRDDRSLLCIPPFELALPIVDENRQRFAESTCSLHGRSLQDVRATTRREALAAARSFTASIVGGDLPMGNPESVVVTGHQPELFHVGVWAKNFATAGVARQSSSTAINLIIDNDTLNSTSLSIPVGNHDHPHIEQIPFDTPRPALPWEEAQINNVEQFSSFGQRIRGRIRETWGFDPLIGAAWDAAVHQMNSSRRLCDALAALRITTERTWGLENLELPMSRLCETDSFRWFVAHLLARLPELHTIYNQSVETYRQEHRLRNQTQPVPNLDQHGEWREAPFWVWQPRAQQRGRLFARQTGSTCEIRDEKQTIATLPLQPEKSLELAVEALRELSTSGYRLRTRALTTTLFARVCLADLFVHGIGGAKYDAITDQICQRFFGLAAPDFLTVSATLYLPLGSPFTTSDSQLRQLNHRIRDLSYNPDRHLADSPDTRRWVQEKSDLLTIAQQQRESNHRRGRLTRDQHHRLAEIRAHLASYASAQKSSYESERKSLLSHLSANHVLRNREFSFVLNPEHQVREFLTPLAVQPGPYN